MVLCRLCPRDATTATETQLSAPAACHHSPTLARAVCGRWEGRSDGSAPPHSLEASAPSKAPATPRTGLQRRVPRTGARTSGRPSSRGDERFDRPLDTLDATSRACGPWLAAPSGGLLWRLRWGHPSCGSPVGIAMRALLCGHHPAGTGSGARGRQATGRALSWVVAGCLFQAILPASASGWDPRSELSDVKEQIMFTASGTSCRNGFICPERGVTLPSAKHNYLYVHTLPGRTKRHTLGSARVGRDPLSGPGSVCAVPCGAPVCQAARSQSDAEVGQACPRPPQPLRTLEAQSGGPRPRRRVICLLRDQQAQATPCPPTKHTARGADPWAIARTHTPVKDADLPAGHVGSFRGDTKEPGRTLPLNVPGLNCQILTSDANGVVCDEDGTSRRWGSAALFPEQKGPSLCRPRARTTHARATSGHVLVTRPGLGSHLWGWCVRGDGNQATDGQTD